MHGGSKRVLHPIVRRLEDEFVAAERKIRLGILPPKRELLNIGEMPLGRSRPVSRSLPPLRQQPRGSSWQEKHQPQHTRHHLFSVFQFAPLQSFYPPNLPVPPRTLRETPHNSAIRKNKSRATRVRACGVTL